VNANPRDHASAGNAAAARKRVRTPGKHIVLFALAVTFMLTLATTAIQSGKVALPKGRPGTVADAQLYSAPQEFIVDLSPDAAGAAAFLKLRMTIRARDRAALAEIEANEGRIRERVAFFLRELSADDFAGTEAAARIKAELLKRTSLPLSPGAASDVVIEEIIIQ